MTALERFIRYITIPSTSNPKNEGVTPSSDIQWDMARQLEKDLKEIGLSHIRVEEHCYVYAELEANIDKKVPSVGFIAHMDTAADFNGHNIQPRVIENYDGGVIVLNEKRSLLPKDYPALTRKVGKTLVVTDGHSLLGADDKAGVTAIMEAMKYLVEHPEIKHGKICVGFTPDEEIGNGPKYFDVKNFGADFAYTIDGGEIQELEDENFNATSAMVKISGNSIHPGSAKNRMINAAKQACVFQTMIPDALSPEHTELREGFIHLIEVKGNTVAASLEYILRDHDFDKLQAQKELLKSASNLLNKQVGQEICSVEFVDSYRNMKAVLDKRPEVVDVAEKAMKKLGIPVVRTAIRGGTDGAQLSFMGLPCPNLGAGGANFHGPYEYLVLDEMLEAIEVMIQIVKEVVEL
ncbi:MULTISPECIES: peptidase T [Terrabacteria group]|uniref:peptidase T n=1 Tax=Bacillati TaxID=1783272 RepID=UPI001C6E5FD0|nr:MULTISPECIES: peptidase T [Terrabacteria group]MBW9212863.1 peptidase T [Trueperella sp. zg.1013]